MQLVHTDRLNSAPHRHGPTNRHVLLRLRLPLPWHFPYDGLQGPIPNLLHAQRLRYANCVVRTYWGCGGSRRWWWTDISICSPNSIPIESLLPPHALWNELFLEWGIYHLCRRHYCGYFHCSGKRCIHGTRESIQSQIAIRLTLHTAGLDPSVCLGYYLDLDHNPLGSEWPTSWEEGVGRKPWTRRHPMGWRYQRAHCTYALCVRAG